MSRTPFDPRTGRHLRLQPDPTIVQQLSIISECTEGDNLNDCLVCEDKDGKTIYAAKPFMLQQTPFDGHVIDGVTYTYSTAYERTADDSADTIDQVITPPYIFGGTEKIIAARVLQPTLDVGARRVEWVDLNTSGRMWVAQHGYVPSGIIVEFEGFGDTIPTGWTLCDGGADSKEDLTPDLSGMFIVGYDAGDADYNAIGDNGGFKLHGATHNDHTIAYRLLTTNVSYSAYIPGGDTDNRPPFYTLAYIRKD